MGKSANSVYIILIGLFRISFQIKSIAFIYLHEKSNSVKRICLYKSIKGEATKPNQMNFGELLLDVSSLCFSKFREKSNLEIINKIVHSAIIDGAVVNITYSL